MIVIGMNLPSKVKVMRDCHTRLHLVRTKSRPSAARLTYRLMGFP